MTTDRDIEQLRWWANTAVVQAISDHQVEVVMNEAASTITALRKRLDQADESAIEQFNEATVLRGEVDHWRDAHRLMREASDAEVERLNARVAELEDTLRNYVP